MQFKNVKEFLDSIGTRPLTDKEAEHLHILKIKEGKASTTNSLLTELEKEASKKK